MKGSQDLLRNLAEQGLLVVVFSKEALADWTSKLGIALVAESPGEWLPFQMLSACSSRLLAVEAWRSTPVVPASQMRSVPSSFELAGRGLTGCCLHRRNHHHSEHSNCLVLVFLVLLV